ncbi:hypothetical protein M0813_09687 [Anaeramoeba flamelloides]|uniref:MULE transposase domain-containing protein n=1 Tax=Anaeramoeba flamelloides TaxID=1746091 RepID=A0ABQ8X745_9EUKA|nr:hypothetical protein M0813_09687 [Anaeramoeba flamelloides]
MFVDGTFLSAPSPFTQLFTIAAWDKATQKYYICNYTLLQGKKAENYEFFFNNLKFIVPGLNPLLITSDFESGITLAINEYFPRSKIVHCKFHFVQCLIRKIDGLKMEKTVRLQKFKDDLKSLQFTEIQNFIPKWEQIVDKYRGDEKYENVMTYFYNNFLLKYPIQNWNYSILPEYCKHLEKRIQEEKQDWTRIVDKLRKKEYFPPQQEKTINYKTIINNYDVEDILITRKKFKNRPIKKKQTVKKNNLNKIKNSVKTKKKKNKIGKRYNILKR